MTTSCPVCSNENCKVIEAFRQATRQEPMQSLGFQGYCPKCNVSFRVTAEMIQLVLA